MTSRRHRLTRTDQRQRRAHVLRDRVRKVCGAGEKRCQQGAFAHRAGDLAEHDRRLGVDHGHLRDAVLAQDLDGVANGLGGVRVHQRRQVPGLGLEHLTDRAPAVLVHEAVGGHPGVVECRAGRDGLPANAWMIYGLGDVVSMRQMLDSGDAPEERKLVERQKLDALLGFCESTSCRHQTLLRYFGEQHVGKCMQCDNCLNPIDTWDASKAAQIAMSAVFRTGQRFGVVHLIDVLLGKTNAKVMQFNHQVLSVFGLGKNLPQAQWSSVFRQLVTGGYLESDLQAHGGLKLTEAARPVLKGTAEIWLRRDTDKPSVRIKANASKAQKSASAKSAYSELSHDPLWQLLKDKRLELAKENSVPPYVIFHDSTLLEIHNQCPKSLGQMSQITGVGQAKLERYGDVFLKVLKEFKDK